ncbi:MULTISPECIES: flagellar basal body-associated FliL family protein [unclassified Sphingobium]|uniref:flagellar basal body-associated FliL family protein n=1 Tax=unclassified Sphingobium TaxID=2611147 RepID=UPI000770553E|nr:MULTISPECIES: flagellar basal body-associated FliL family protein [Sphingomonadaceae]AMK22030.1 flagellar basal body-associated protein FliL [Sphingobium sp. TKS]NML88067.1 flagellar basal body-associated FliL family protein [Sphingobium sp. TB-6]
MSDDAKPKKKKGGGMKMILLIVIAMVVGGAGAAGGLYAAGFFSPKEEGPKEDPNKPVLVLAGESAEDVAKAHGYAGGGGGGGEGGGHEGGGGGHVASGVHVPAKGIDLPVPANPAAYQATYFQLQTPFTSNMSDTDAFAQISIAISTYYDIRVVEAIKAHETAIRSQVLMMLAEQPVEALSTPAGKRALQGKIKAIINDILKQKTGYGGVDNVYFTNFVIQ